MTTVRRCLLLLLVTVAQGARAQYYGQWSWNASASLGQNYSRIETPSSTGTTYDQRELSLSLGLNGFILSPSVAKFRLGLDAVFSQFRNGSSYDSDFWGGKADLSLFPGGGYPVQLYLGRQRFDYTLIGSDLPYSFLNVPDTGMVYGGRVRIRRGLLRGLAVGLDRTRVDFVGEKETTDLTENEFAEWSRQVGIFSPRVRLERRLEEYGNAGLRFEDWIASADEHSAVGGSWRWDFSGMGYRRTTEFLEQNPATFDIVRISNLVSRVPDQGNSIYLTHNFGFRQAEGGSAQVANDASARYLWNLSDQWRLTPYAGYLWSQSGETDSSGPNFGVTVTWLRSLRPFDLSVTGSVNYVALSQETPQSKSDASALGYEIAATASLGKEDVLLTDLTGSHRRNRAELTGEALPQFPDLGVTASSLVENRTTARLTLSRRVGLSYARLWADYETRESSPDFESVLAFRFERFACTATYQFPSGNILASAGVDRLEGSVSQHIRFVSASLNFDPWAWLRTSASLRTDDRELVGGVTLRGWRAEGSATMTVGAFYLRARAFLTTENEGAVEKQRNWGVVWSISRQFGGWLPIVTSPRRKGTVR